MENLNNKKGQKQILDLNKKENKNALIESRKESIKNGNVFDNVDFLNLLSQTSKIKVEKNKSVNEKHFIYKFERTNVDSKKAQSLRQKIRKQINSKVDNILFYFNQKDELNLKSTILDFKNFYVETYILNDYSIESIYATHIDIEKRNKLKLALDIIKLF